MSCLYSCLQYFHTKFFVDVINANAKCFIYFKSKITLENWLRLLGTLFDIDPSTKFVTILLNYFFQQILHMNNIDKVDPLNSIDTNSPLGKHLVGLYRLKISKLHHKLTRTTKHNDNNTQTS